VIAKHAQEIDPFVVMEVMERAQELEAKGEHLIHLEVGEPDFPTPACIHEAATKALKDGLTGYTHSLGFFRCARPSPNIITPSTACRCRRIGFS